MRTFDYTMNAIKLLTPEIVQMIGRISKAQGELVGQVVLFGHAVLVLYVGIRDRVQHQVHSREAQHRRVSVKAREGFAGEDNYFNNLLGSPIS